MITFKEYLAEQQLKFVIDINQELRSFIIQLLNKKGYEAKLQDQSIICNSRGFKADQFQDELYSAITKEFTNGNETLVKFVGSDDPAELVNSDLEIEVTPLA